MAKHHQRKPESQHSRTAFAAPCGRWCDYCSRFPKAHPSNPLVLAQIWARKSLSHIKCFSDHQIAVHQESGDILNRLLLNWDRRQAFRELPDWHIGWRSTGNRFRNRLWKRSAVRNSRIDAFQTHSANRRGSGTTSFGRNVQVDNGACFDGNEEEEGSNYGHLRDIRQGTSSGLG